MPAGDRRGLFGIGDRFQDTIEHVRRKRDTVRHKLGAKPGKGLGCRLKSLAHLGIDRGKAKIHAGPDFQSVQPARGHIEAARADRQARRVTRIMGGNHLQQQCGVRDGSCDRSGVRQRRP
jgi:hypothetical protein